jgi:hypothetical protein
MSMELAQREPTVMEILSQAVLSGNVSVDVIERLVKLQRDQVEYQAMVEFNRSMHRCQQKMKQVAADMANPQTKSRYASYAQIDRSVRTIYTDEGFSLSFGDGDPIAPEFIRLICYVSHIAGHTRMYHKDMPVVTAGPQGKAVMTATHAHGSSDSYAKRYLVKDIFNLSIVENDDDGNSVPPEITKIILKMYAATTTDELMEIYKEPYKAAFISGSPYGKILVEAKNKRWNDLTKETA